MKADGARNRLFNAPGDHEPQITENTDTVLPIASARIVGEPLTEEFVHRPERVADLADLDIGDEIRPRTSRASWLASAAAWTECQTGRRRYRYSTCVTTTT